MANEIIRARLQSPQDDHGTRKDIMLVTDVTSVVVDGTDPEHSDTLDNVINDMQEAIETAVEKVTSATDIRISKLVPSGDKPHIWAQVLTDYWSPETDYVWNITSSSTVPGSLEVVRDSIPDEEFNPTTMITVSELLAYDPLLSVQVGMYAYKTAKE